MFKPCDGRDPLGIPVGGYMNLRTGLWSFRALAGPDNGKKVADGDSATLVDVVPFVRHTTRNRLVAAKANPGAGKGSKGFREVHAWLVGTLLPDDVITPDAASRQVTYRPFDRADFFYTDDGSSFTGAAMATFDIDRRVYVVSA